MELRVIESLHPAEAEEYKSDVMSKSIRFQFYKTIIFIIYFEDCVDCTLSTSSGLCYQHNPAMLLT